MTPANDKGPQRYFAQDAVDVRDLSLQFLLDEDLVRQLCLEHHEEIRDAIRQIAYDAFEQIAYREGAIELESQDLELPFTHIAWR